MSTQKLDLEKLFNEAKVKPGETFYSMEYGEVKFESVSHFLGTTLLNFRTRHGNFASFTCDGYYYAFDVTEHIIKIFPSVLERDWFKWAEKRIKTNTYLSKMFCNCIGTSTGIENENKCEENLFQIENKIVYLVIKPENIMKELTIREWNDFIDRYSNDKNSVVEPYDENMDGYFFVTTSLENILNNHLLTDLRFLVRERTEYHKTNYKL